jgi:hypothetical protein
MRLPLIALALLLAGCDGASAPIDPGGGSASTPPSAASPTAASITVTYEYSSIASLSVNGTAHAHGRKFGPYVLTADQLPSGDTLGLVFDPSDAGDTNLCITGLEDDGSKKAEGCVSFQLIANQMVQAEVELHQ